MADGRGTQEQFWIYMDMRLRANARAGQLTSAIQLVHILGQALGLAAEADYVWLRECCRDANLNAGVDGATYAALVQETKDSIEELKRLQPKRQALEDIAGDTARKYGLN